MTDLLCVVEPQPAADWGVEPVGHEQEDLRLHPTQLPRLTHRQEHQVWVFFIYCTYCIVYTLRSLQIRTFLSDPNLPVGSRPSCRFWTLFVRSGSSSRVRTFFVGSRPSCRNRTVFCRIRTFLSDPDLLVGSGPTCQIRTFLSDPDLFVGSGPRYLLNPDLLVGSGPTCRIRTFLLNPGKSRIRPWKQFYTQTKTVKFSTKRLTTTVWNKLNNIFFSLSFCFSDYALEKESKEIIKSGPPPPR